METSSANFIQAYFIKRMQWVSVIFVMFYIKSPAPFFRHPPEGTPTRPHTLPRRFSERGEGMCVYNPIPRGRDTPPPLFPLPPNPLPSRLYLWPPDPQPVKPRPCLMASAPSRSRNRNRPDRAREIHRNDTATAEAHQLQRKYLIAP